MNDRMLPFRYVVSAMFNFTLVFKLDFLYNKSDKGVDRKSTSFAFLLESG